MALLCGISPLSATGARSRMPSADGVLGERLANGVQRRPFQRSIEAAVNDHLERDEVAGCGVNRGDAGLPAGVSGDHALTGDDDAQGEDARGHDCGHGGVPFLDDGQLLVDPDIWEAERAARADQLMPDGSGRDSTHSDPRNS